MPFEIKLKEVSVGYAQTSVQKGENASIIVREFTSSEDGDLFISRLEGIPSDILAAIPDKTIKPSSVDRFLAVIRPDHHATVYLNDELKLLVTFTIKGKDIEAGEAVFSDNIADIQQVTFHGISVPEDTGIVFVFSQGWRKGFYFDLVPLIGPSFTRRNYDLTKLLGQSFAYLVFQHLFKITESEWAVMLDQKWFPFITLKNHIVKEIIAYARNQWNIDDLTERVAEDLRVQLPSIVRKWHRNNLFESHVLLFEQAVNRYLAGDYISASAILYPRIEGLMRSYLNSHGLTLKPSPKNLVTSVIDANVTSRHDFSSLLPKNFSRYLTGVYFANFDPQNPEILSRHTVAHGVAPANDFSLKAATIGLLLLDQLSFYLSPRES
jgi:hypothetical protein